MADTCTRLYRSGRLEREDVSLDEVPAVADEPDVVVWVDLCDPAEGQLEALAERMGLHELAVEDALSPHQRPKLDRYGAHLFVSCHAVAVDEHLTELTKTEIDAFVGPNWLITIRKGDAFRMDQVTRRWDDSSHLAGHGVGYLLYGLLDVVVDGYFEVVQRFDDLYDDIGDQIFSEHPLTPDQQKAWFAARRTFVRFHRLVTPLREVINSLMRHDQETFSQDLYPYLQDVYDHVLLVSEATEALRDLSGTIVETNLSLRDYRQNQVVKQVTSWAAIVAIPTLITGYYGMNVPYPGAGQDSGVLVSTVLMIVASVGLYATFKRRDWL